jgi:hypothetical protein
VAGFRSIFRSPVPHIRNEQIKLTANMLNTLAAAFIVVGVIPPVLLILPGFSGQRATTAAFAAFILGMILAFVFHVGALQVLEKLAPPENVAQPTPHAEGLGPS